MSDFNYEAKQTQKEGFVVQEIKIPNELFKELQILQVMLGNIGIEVLLLKVMESAIEGMKERTVSEWMEGISDEIEKNKNEQKGSNSA